MILKNKSKLRVSSTNICRNKLDQSTGRKSGLWNLAPLSGMKHIFTNITPFQIFKRFTWKVAISFRHFVVNSDPFSLDTQFIVSNQSINQIIRQNVKWSINQLLVENFDLPITKSDVYNNTFLIIIARKIIVKNMSKYVREAAKKSRLRGGGVRP